MKTRILITVVAGVVLQMSLENLVVAQEQQPSDSLLQGIIKSLGSSKEDKSGRESGQYWDSRDEGSGSRRDYRRDDDSDYHHRDNEGRHSRTRTSDPDVIVRRAYEDILNREPDQEGLRVYRSRMIDDNWSEQDVRDALRKSSEHAKQNTESVDKVVRRAYQDVLGREPDREGLATYRSKIQDEGWSERDVRSDLKKSSERREKGDVSSEQAQQIVRRAYRNMLGRDPDSGSSVYVEKVMRSHWSEDDVAKELRNSAEYRKKHGK